MIPSGLSLKHEKACRILLSPRVSRFQTRRADCHVDGVVDGSVIADKDPEAFLTISENGLVDGSVRVPRVHLNGKVQGDVFATELVELGPTAKVNGNVHYELLEMTAGAEINGKLIHESAHVQSSTAPRPTAADNVQSLQTPEAVEVG